MKHAQRQHRHLAIYKSATDIVCPLLPGELFQSNPQPVNVDSAPPLRRAVWRMAMFFKMEFRYDFVQYGFQGRDDDPSHVAFLWTHPECNHLISDEDASEFRMPAIGACCFRWVEWDNVPHCWTLRWIWIHPFQRRRKLLSRAWPMFREKFGDFMTEAPLSDGMNAFLASRKECWLCGRSCRPDMHERIGDV